MGNFRYTEEHIAFIREKYQHHEAKVVTEMFNKQFGTNIKVKTMQAIISRRGIRTTRCGRFQKGEKNVNVVKPELHEHHTPNGYWRIKVRTGCKRKGITSKYVAKQIYVWEQAYGPVPPGYVVIFKDCDKENFALDNLELMTRSELLKLNRNKYKEQPDELKPAVLALSKLQAAVSAVKQGDAVAA